MGRAVSKTVDNGLVGTEVVISGEKDAYTAFPTFVTHEGEIFLYYRKGVTDRKGAHGKRGRIRLLRFSEAAFLDGFGKTSPLSRLGRDDLVFGVGNEMDAIVSQLRPDRYSLATRNYDENKIMRTYISFASEPVFKERTCVEIDGLDWFAFYGKAFLAMGMEVFPAYGSMNGEVFGRPLLLTHNGEGAWRVLAALPSYFDRKTVLNESSVARCGKGWMLFMRQDTKPFGLWTSYSEDLISWCEPEKWRDAAHAPMAVNAAGRICLCFRNIMDSDRASTALAVFPEDGPVSDPKKFVNLDVYEGSIYDGGYGDLGWVGTDLVVFYYHGNLEGEPFLKAARLSLALFPMGSDNGISGDV